ncbi:glycine-rich domain-containing protein [Massilia psychrophila]|uniref:glycine-rich domain-containing protein n=1 Tax=Massilia psychrophila TaxID=1603353 RepID=UPI00117D1BAD|nr:glycine-rich domain-containing protein-like [Massilia psychrophila]GGE88540.1 hypothetical protein GCM10008020_36960 [Massilia psychrophila]
MNSNAKLNVIAALDLNPIKVKLMHKESGEGWSLEQVNEVELEYRRFLHLLKLFPNEPVSPRFDVDIFWHYHILDTMKYAADCEQIFGYFLHHNPYSGLGGKVDEADHHRTGARTQELYEMTFGEAYLRQAAIAQNDRSYSMHSVSKAAKIAWCDAVAQNDRSYSANPVLALAQIAWCDAVAQNDKSYSARPVSRSAKMAWCDAVARNDRSYSAGQVVGSAKMAWCDAVASGKSYSASPVSGSAKMAWCDAVAQNDRSYSARSGTGSSKMAAGDGVAQNAPAIAIAIAIAA